MWVATDLDGTLLTCNSFRKWVLFQASYFVRTMMWVRLLELVAWFALRRIGFLSHQQFKKKLLCRGFPEVGVQEFADSLMPFVNHSVVEMIVAAGQKNVLLTTAAPATYIPALAERLPLEITEFHASSMEHGDLVENIGTQKVKRFRSKFGSEKCVLFITDHEDDLPMALEAEQVALVLGRKQARTLLELNIPTEQLLFI